jgi:AraC family transcriptional regulator
MEGEIKVGHRDALGVVSKRIPVRLSEIGGVLGASFGEVYGFLGAQRVALSGPPFVIYHEVPNGDEPFAIEICAPVGGPAGAPPGWLAQELPGGLFATTLHVGPYDTVATAYQRVSDWLAANGYVIAGPPREVYLSDPSTPPDQVRTIVEFPVALAGTAG